MADVPERPVLRIVQPDEVRPETPDVTDVIEPSSTVEHVVSPPSSESVAFKKAAENVDATIPLTAAYAVSAGCYLADQALDFHHQAVANAPADTFRNDIPPGLKSAQATRTWLETHLTAIKKKSTEPDAATAPYARGRDLRAAVVLAGSELDRALDATKTAGLYFWDRAAGLFDEARESLTTAVTMPAIASSEPISKTSSATETYLIGCDVLAITV